MNGPGVGLEESRSPSDVADQGAFAGNTGDSLLAVRAGRRHARRAALPRAGGFWLVAAGACGLFLAAHGAGLLFAARALQGAAVGTAVSALGAALIDLQPDGSGLAPMVTTAASMLGLAVGGLVQVRWSSTGPAPTRLVWWLLLGVSLAAAVAVGAMPETTPGRAGAGRAAAAGGRAAAGAGDVRIGAAVPDRGVDAQRVPPSLGPSLAAQVLRSPGLLWGGLVIFLVAGTGTAGTGAGFGTAMLHVGLHRTALVYGAAIAVLASVAAGSLALRKRSAVRASCP